VAPGPTLDQHSPREGKEAVERTSMSAWRATQAAATALPVVEFDAIVGAGMSGMNQLIRLRGQGMRVRVSEAGSGVGGTRYWNRYPGRFDFESCSYGFSFSKELLEEWSWSEHFAPQPGTLRYLNHVADEFGLRRDVRFRSRATSAHYQEDTRSWTVTLEEGGRHTARFLITALGALSAPTLPRLEGMDAFRGQAFHTARWPHEPMDFRGKHVAVIGTGATGVRVIQTIAGEVEHLTVFRRTPNWPRRCTTARSPRRRRSSARSGPATPRSSGAAGRPSPASCTRRTRAAPSR
jgi:cation diffusion facilitator CzcD-associated flavoprotein CzcO